MYTFIAARSASDITDSAHTLGVEVTIPEVARQCWLGNVDGQHARGEQDEIGLCLGLGLGMGAPAPGSIGLPPRAWRGRAAVDIATEIQMPPDGTVLATVRPDLDSVGAMAVLVLRRLGIDLDHVARARVARVAEVDTFRPSAEWTPSALPTPDRPWPTGACPVDSTRELAHVAAICAPRFGEATLPLSERVALVAVWLICGDDPVDDSTATRILSACGVSAVDPAGLARSPSWATDTILASRERVAESRRELAREASRPGAIEIYSEPAHVAVVRVAHDGAFGLGYCVAPVVVAFDQATPGKVTIAAYGPRYLDLARLRERLNELERGAQPTLPGAFVPPSWGGPATLLGSPQVYGTHIPDATIVAEVVASLR